MERHSQWLWDLSKWKRTQGRELEICSLIQEPAEKSKQQTHRPQREWDENLLGTGTESTELVATKSLISLETRTGNVGT